MGGTLQQSRAASSHTHHEHMQREPLLSSCPPSLHLFFIFLFPNYSHYPVIPLGSESLHPGLPELLKSLFL